MIKRIIITIFFFSFFENYMFSQNNYIDNPKIYYNLRDTTNSIYRGSVTVPMLILIDDELKDSILYLINKIHPMAESGWVSDSNGFFISTLLCYMPEDEDTNNMHILLQGLPNYYMNSYISDEAYESINHFFVPESHHVYCLGCFYCNGYLVHVISHRYIQPQETERFFLTSNDFLTFRIYEESPLKMSSNSASLGSKKVIKPLFNQRNYVSPIWPR